MILPIIQAPDARLLQPSLPVGLLSTVLGDLFGALIDTRINHDGVGLSRYYGASATIPEKTYEESG